MATLPERLPSRCSYLLDGTRATHLRIKNSNKSTAGSAAIAEQLSGAELDALESQSAFTNQLEAMNIALAMAAGRQMQLPAFETFSEQIELPALSVQLMAQANNLAAESELMATRQRLSPHLTNPRLQVSTIEELALTHPRAAQLLTTYLAELYEQSASAKNLDGGVKIGNLSMVSSSSLSSRNGFVSSLSNAASLFSGTRADPIGGGSTFGSATIHLIGLLAALLTTFLLVKLMMRRSLVGDKTTLSTFRRSAGGSIRSLWCSIGSGNGSSAGSSPDAATCEAGGHLSSSAALKAAEAGNPMRAAPPPYFESAASLPESRKNVDLLIDRLSTLLSRKSAKVLERDEAAAAAEDEEDKRRTKKQVKVKAVTCKERISEELDEASAMSESTLTTNTTMTNQPGRFRSSRSYIKSLVDALAKARAQFPSVNLLSGNGNAAGCGTSGLVDDDTCGSEMTCDENGSQTGFEVEGNDPGVMVSQMDISAAHLILSYMEKHLEDKEQLEREWRELQAPSGGIGQTINGSSQQSTTAIGRATLQKLAKVALSEDNRYKNRNSQLVPYDRNRVKLGTYCNTSRRRPAKQQQTSPNIKSDYINASYIYDDEPRKPTHIIAQGPTEQTVAQFWQMVWESGVSVLVMLTRLNENSVSMCHCYWPTSSSQANTATAQDTLHESHESATMAAAPTSGNGKIQPTEVNLVQLPAANGATNGRRGSVTSVFNTPLARSSASGQPIIANGDPNKNSILVFEVVHHNQKQPQLTTTPSTTTTSTTTTTTASGEEICVANHNSAATTTTTTTTTTKFEVHLVSEHVSSNDYLVRNMYMINRTTGETRTITQFHYLSWPESSVPENVKSLLQFRRKVHKSYRNLDSPILVHCSDGGGRSGTYVLVDMILERIRKGAKEIDPRATLEHLRDQRVGLCATQSQFEFVLMALAEEIQIILNALPQ